MKDTSFSSERFGVRSSIEAKILVVSQNMIDRWATYRSATICVSGKGFMARDIRFHNVAGPGKKQSGKGFMAHDIRFHNVAGPGKKQAVALHVNSQSSTFYRCTISAFEDALYDILSGKAWRKLLENRLLDKNPREAISIFWGCNKFR